MTKVTSGWYPEVDVARQAQKIADGCTTVQVGPIVCAHLRACALLSTTGQRWTAALLQCWHIVDLLRWQVAFLQCWHRSATLRWQAVDHAVLSVDQASCRVARKPHTQHRCFSHLNDAWRAEFGDEAERPRWAELLRWGVAIFDLDYDAILAAMYALSVSAEGDCYLCVPLDPGIEASALGASESALPGTTPAEAFHTFTLDSVASRYFFRDSTTLTPLSAPVPVRLADPSGGPVLAHSSTVLPCPAVPSGSLSGLHLPSFSTNLLSAAALQDVMVTTTTSGGQRVSIYTCTRTGRHLATFTRRPGSSLYTLATEPPQTLLWHHRIGHPSLPRLCGKHSRLLVSSLPRSLPPLPPSPALPCLPFIEGRQRAARHSSSFPPTAAPLQTLHMDVKGEVPDVFIPWIRAVRLQLRERFCQELPVLRLHSDRGAQPLASCLLAGDLTHTALDGEGWRCVGVTGLGLSCLCSRYVRGQALRPYYSCVFLGFTSDAPDWQFYHPTSRHVFPSQDVTFDEPGPAPSGVSQVDPLPGTVPVEVAVNPGAARGAASGGVASRGVEPGGAEPAGVESGGAEPAGADSKGAGSRGAEPGGAEPAGAEPAGVESGGAEPAGVEPGGAESGGAEPWGTASSGGPAGALPRLGAARVGDSAAGDTGAGGAGVTAGAGGTAGAAAAGPHTKGTGAAGTGGVGSAGAGDPTEPGAAGAGGARAGGSGAGGAGAGGAGADGAGAGGTGAGGVGAGAGGAVDPGARGAGGIVRPRPYFVPLLQQVLGLPSSTGLSPPLLCLTERREPASRLASPVRTGPRPPPVPGTHAMALRPSSVPLRVPLPPPPESSLPAVPDPESDRARAASPTISRLLATVVIDPSFESTAALPSLLSWGECALGTDVLEDKQEDFECLAAAVPHFASTLLAPDAPDIPTPRSYAEAITGPYSSQWHAAMDAEMAFWKSTRTYIDAVPPSRANIVDGMWIFRVKRPPGSPPAYKARYVARGFSQRQGVDYFLNFSPTPKMTNLRGSLHEEIWLRRPPGFTGTTLADLGFTPSTADPSLFLRTDTPLPSFYVFVYVLQRFGFHFSSPQPTPLSTGHSLSAPPSDESANAKRVLRYLCNTSGMGLVLGGWGQVVLTGHADASWVNDSATQRSSQGYTFSLGSGSVSWRPTCSSSVLSSSCEAEIYARAMAAQELRWLTYLLTDLGEQPRSPLVLYVDNKAMFALCREHKLEHRTKHIALRYFLARELQQLGQLRFAYVTTRANKALPLGDHQRFPTVLGLLALLFLTGLVTTCSPPLCLWRPTLINNSSSLFVFVVVAGDADFASTRRLDDDTSLVSAPACLKFVGGALALGSKVLGDRQFELAFLAVAAPHRCAIILDH
ncbi:unnamed protein product [Closterium sp. NIES-53]